MAAKLATVAEKALQKIQDQVTCAVAMSGALQKAKAAVFRSIASSACNVWYMWDERDRVSKSKGVYIAMWFPTLPGNHL